MMKDHHFNLDVGLLNLLFPSARKTIAICGNKYYKLFFFSKNSLQLVNFEQYAIQYDSITNYRKLLRFVTSIFCLQSANFE